MEELRELGVKAKSSQKNGDWEIILTDPSLNKFSFAEAISNKYVMTDVISPLGQKLTLYNTVPSKSDEKLVIGLNLEEIDQTRIKSISIKSNTEFFANWVVHLVDNRSEHSVSVSDNQVLDINPAIELNKLMSMGFTENSTRKNKPLFELHLSKHG